MSTNIIKVFFYILDKICFICNIIAGFSIVLMTVIFSWLVYGRYILNSTPTWVEQISLLLIVLISFLGAAVGIYKKTHLGVSYFRNLCSPFFQRLCDVLSYLMLSIFGSLMCFYSYKLVIFKWSTQIPLIHVPEGLRAVPIMICGGLVLIFSIGHLINIYLDIKNNK